VHGSFLFLVGFFNLPYGFTLPLSTLAPNFIEPRDSLLLVSLRTAQPAIRTTSDTVAHSFTLHGVSHDFLRF
jgi:hypothetical protein